MQGIIWKYEQKLLDIFRQTAKGNIDWFIFFEKSSDKKCFSTRYRGILCDAEKGDKSAQREIWGFYARRAHTHASRFARGFCRDSGNITSDISHIIKKNPVIGIVSGASLHYWFDYVWSNEACCKTPCDRVRIGCAFVLLIWLCLKQRSLLERTLWSGSYRVCFCTFDLIVFEAMKHRLRGGLRLHRECVRFR